MTMLYAVAKTDCRHFAISVTGPGDHGIRVCIVEHNAIVSGDISNVLTKLEHFRYSPLSIHDSTCAQRIPNTLINAVFKWDLNILLKCLQATDSNNINNILRISQSFPAIGGRFDLDVE